MRRALPASSDPATGRATAPACASYKAGELHDDHPVRFTNEGLRLDNKPENAIEWYVKIPHHEDYHLWMPAQPDPEQRGWSEALNAGDATMGESRLFERDGTWYLHVTATRDVEERSEVSAEERTPIGVDIGEASLVTVSRKSKISDESSKTLRVFEMSPRRPRFSDRARTVGRRGQDRSSAPQDLLHRQAPTPDAR